MPTTSGIHQKETHNRFCEYATKAIKMIPSVRDQLYHKRLHKSNLFYRRLCGDMIKTFKSSTAIMTIRLLITVFCPAHQLEAIHSGFFKQEPTQPSERISSLMEVPTMDIYFNFSQHAARCIYPVENCVLLTFSYVKKRAIFPA